MPGYDSDESREIPGEFFLADSPAFVRDSESWRRGHALPLQRIVHDFFLRLRALLLFEDVAAGQLAERFPRALWPVRFKSQADAQQPPRALDASRQRGL